MTMPGYVNDTLLCARCEASWEDHKEVRHQLSDKPHLSVVYGRLCPTKETDDDGWWADEDTFEERNDDRYD